MRKVMASLDIGYSSIKFIVAEVVKSKVYILTSSITPNDCVVNDTFDEAKLAKRIQEIRKKSEEKLGIPIKSTLLIVPSVTCAFTTNTCRIDIKSQDNLITALDVNEVIKASAKNVVQENMELVNVLPMYYTLDDGTKTNNPINTFSKTLSVKSIITSSKKEDVYFYLRVLESIGLDVVDISYDSIGDYCTFASEETATTCGAVINIGHKKTTVSIFNKGILTNTATIKLGGLNVINDISYVYKLDYETSKVLNSEFALANSKTAAPNETIVVKNKDAIRTVINQYELSEVVASRLKEILNVAKKQINTLTKRQISYIIYTGGIANMKDFNQTVSDVFGPLASIGYLNTIGVRDNRYSSCLGLIKWYDYNAKLKCRDYSILSLEEQEEFSKEGNQTSMNSNGIIGKVFDYFFDN